MSRSTPSPKRTRAIGRLFRGIWGAVRRTWLALAEGASWANHHAPLLALIIGAPWAIYQFWYKELFVPSQRPAFAVVDASIACGTSEGPLVPVTCKIAVSNPGPREADVFLAYYIIEAARLVRADLSDPAYIAAAKRALADSVDITHRYVVDVHRQPICTGKILNAIGTLMPGQHTEADVVTYVPRDSFDVVRVYAFVVTQKQYAQVAPAWEIIGGGYVRFRLARLVSWGGPGTGTYEAMDPSDPRIPRLGLSPTIARSEAIIPGSRTVSR